MTEYDSSFDHPHSTQADREWENFVATHPDTSPLEAFRAGFAARWASALDEYEGQEPEFVAMARGRFESLHAELHNRTRRVFYDHVTDVRVRQENTRLKALLAEDAGIAESDVPLYTRIGNQRRRIRELEKLVTGLRSSAAHTDELAG